MKDFILLFKNPREIFCKEREKTSVFGVFLLFLATYAVSFAVSMKQINNDAFGSLLKQIHLNAYVLVPIFLFFSWLTVVIAVSILSPIFRICVRKIDSINIENKKNFKSLIYLCYLIPSIITIIFDSIYTLITNNAQQPPYLSPCTSIYTSLIFSIMLSYILDHVYHGKKSRNIIPVVYFLITTASTVIGLFSK
ncbi:MAG: hypothetical protein PHT76_15155 [Anaerostipes sp.]|nr:hypothetical protein [Anaerostipes sp.]